MKFTSKFNKILKKPRNPVLFGITLVILYLSLQVHSIGIIANFVNWDDMWHIKNPVVQSISSESIIRMFTDFDTYDMYMPLTILSWATNIATTGMNPAGFHLTNLFLHVASAGLLFWFAFLLFDSLPVAFLIGLLFGIGPIHVEGVAWMSGRKDVLYTFFYISSLLSYVRYRKSPSRPRYMITFILFLLALFAKGQAVSLALVLFMIDILFDLDFKNPQLMMEKVPFLSLAFIFGVINLFAVKVHPAYDKFDYPMMERLAMGSFAFVKYIQNIILPVNLSPIVPYPQQYLGYLPLWYYFFLPVFPLFFWFQWIMFKTHRKIWFGLIFYAVNILFMLQFISNSNQLMGDHYVHAAAIGIHIVTAFFIFQLYQRLKRPQSRNFLIIGVAIYLSALGVTTFFQTQIWNNSATLWTRVLRKYPNEYNGLAGLGHAYFQQGQYLKATAIYEKVVQLYPRKKYSLLHYYLGVGYDKLKDDQRAILNYTQYLNTMPDGIEQFQQNPSPAGLLNYDKFQLQTNEGIINAHYGRGYLLVEEKKYLEAIPDFSAIIQAEPHFPEAWANRAYCYYNLQDYKKALADYYEAIKRYGRGNYTRKDVAITMYMKGLTHLKLNQKDLACQSLKNASALEFAKATEELKRLNCPENP